MAREPAPRDGGRRPDVPELWDQLAAEVAAGGRFAGLFGTARPGGLLLSAHLAGPGGVGTLEAVLPAGAAGYPALTPRLGAAFWYEREIGDMFGVVPEGHPRPEPLLLPLPPGDAPRPGPGAPGGPPVIEPDPRALPRHVIGPGLFTIPHGPVRSGVMESVEYLVETPGEEIPHLNMRVFYKHRGIEKRFEGMTAADGVLLAERVEGTASVAHALAYCHALERIAGTEVPGPPRWSGCCTRSWNGLPATWTSRSGWPTRRAGGRDRAVRLAQGAGAAAGEPAVRQPVRARGRRARRGQRLPAVSPGEMLAAIGRLDKAVTADVTTLMGTASFLDRLRRTGPLSPERAREHGALGPVGKGSGFC